MPLQWYARGSRGVFVPVSRHPLWVHIGMRAKRGSRGRSPWRGLGCPQILPFFSFAAGGGRRKGVQRASLCLTPMPMGILYGCSGRCYDLCTLRRIIACTLMVRYNGRKTQCSCHIYMYYLFCALILI